MSTNKNADIRYLALDKCFRDCRHRYYIDDLIDACEEALEDYNRHGGTVGRLSRTLSSWRVELNGTSLLNEKRMARKCIIAMKTPISPSTNNL